MNDFQFVSEDYSIQNAQNYRLSIQLDRDGFSVLVRNPKKVMKVAYRNSGSAEASYSLFKSTEEFIQLRELPFAEVRIILNSDRYNLYPESLSPEMDPAGVFLSEFSPSEEAMLQTITIPGSDHSICFEVLNIEKKLISAFRNKPVVLPFGLPFMEYCLHYPVKKSECLFIYSTATHIHFLYRNEDRLMDMHAQTFCDEDELVYHLINTVRAWNFKGEIVYSGHLEHKHPAMKLIRRYLPDTRRVPNPLNFELAWDGDESYFRYMRIS